MQPSPRRNPFTLDDWLIGVGVPLPLMALVWWYVSDPVSSDRMIAGPIILAIVGAAMTLYGVILLAGRRRSRDRITLA